MKRMIFISRMWSWVCLVIALIICSTLNHVSKASQAALIGTVYCDTCFGQEFISGALVAVECGGDGIQSSGWKPRFREEVKTDGKGEFRVKLPFSAIKDFNVIKGCSVKLISSSESECAVAATTASSPIRLKMKTPIYHVFSAGFFTFQPLIKPRECRAKTRNQNSNDEFSALPPSPLAIPLVTNRKQTTMADRDIFGFPYLQHQFPLQPSLQFQPPPDSIFNLGLQPPPDSTFNLGLQPPPDSMFNPGFLPPPPDSIGFQSPSNSFGFQAPPPPPDSMFNPGFQQPPPDSSTSNPELQPPPDSIFNPDFQPPPDSIFNPDFQPPPESIFNPDFQPPPDSLFDPTPLQPPPDSTFNPFQPSPSTLTPQASTPPPLVPVSPQSPPPDSIESPPSPPVASLPPFPFLPGSGRPAKPPATSFAKLKKTSSP